MKLSAGYVRRPTIPILTRSLGNFLWLKSSILSYVVAHRQFNQQRTEVTLCGVKSSSYNLIIATDFLIAGILFTIATSYAENPLNPLQITGNLSWLLSAIHGTGLAIYNRTSKIHSTVLSVQFNKPVVEIISSATIFKPPSKIAIQMTENTVIIPEHDVKKGVLKPSSPTIR